MAAAAAGKSVPTPQPQQTISKEQAYNEERIASSIAASAGLGFVLSGFNPMGAVAGAGWGVMHHLLNDVAIPEGQKHLPEGKVRDNLPLAGFILAVAGASYATGQGIVRVFTKAVTQQAVAEVADKLPKSENPVVEGVFDAGVRQVGLEVGEVAADVIESNTPKILAGGQPCDSPTLPPVSDGSGSGSGSGQSGDGLKTRGRCGGPDTKPSTVNWPVVGGFVGTVTVVIAVGSVIAACCCCKRDDLRPGDRVIHSRDAESGTRQTVEEVPANSNNVVLRGEDGNLTTVPASEVYTENQNVTTTQV